MRILVTGGSGFVGSAVLERFSGQAHYTLVAAVREPSVKLPPGVIPFAIRGLIPEQDWRSGLEDTEAVVHLAARVHVMHDTASDPLAAFRLVNVEGTLQLANQAAAAGVKRFVFVSSIKVNGEQTMPGAPFQADDAPAPVDPYGVSKLEAEQGLRRLAAETGLEVVIIRPPLVYGPGVKANFLRMMSWVQRGYPLPLGSIHNRRSLVALENLVDLIETCVRHPAAAQQTFLISDGEDVSTTELFRRTALAMGKKAFLLPVPAFVLETGAAMLGKRAVAQRLCGSLQIDIGKTCDLLGWTPPLTLDQGLKRAVEGFK